GSDCETRGVCRRIPSGAGGAGNPPPRAPHGWAISLVVSGGVKHSLASECAESQGAAAEGQKRRGLGHVRVGGRDGAGIYVVHRIVCDVSEKASIPQAVSRRNREDAGVQHWIAPVGVGRESRIHAEELEEEVVAACREELDVEQTTEVRA